MNPLSPQWLALVISLPTRNATARMRIWRALKALGCAVLRDGVYLLPAGEDTERALLSQEQETIDAGGSAHLLRVASAEEGQNTYFRSLFDRRGDYTKLIEEMAKVRDGGTAKQLHSLRREFNAIAAIDFFPGEAKRQAEASLASLEWLLAPQEPHAIHKDIPTLDSKAYQGRRWATRKHLWVDRMASAWLIRRFIDGQARFLWLEQPGDCPADALGFDFDGAAFTHVGSRVTFQVLQAAFSLGNDVALNRLGSIVHYLDAGGIPAPEAAGLEMVLAGARQRCPDDDALLEEAVRIFDNLHAALAE